MILILRPVCIEIFLVRLISFMARIKPQALLQQSKKKKGPSRISATTVVLYGLIVLVMVFFLFATYRHWTQRFVGFHCLVYNLLFWRNCIN